MNKILVTTDFSEHAQAAIQFAIQLAAQQNSHLTFFHSYHLMRPTQWNDKVFSSFEQSEHTKVCAELKQCVVAAYESSGVAMPELDCIAERGVSPAQHIMDYALTHGYDYICISRKGGGKSSSIFGTNTSSLITKSAVPVIAVPEDYVPTPISEICYASDLSHLDQELEKVSRFTATLPASVTLLHFKTPTDELIPAEEIERMTEKLKAHHISLRIETLDHEQSLVNNIDHALERSSASMLMMFTQQKRSLFERIFMSSISADYAAVAKIPILVFKKD